MLIRKQTVKCVTAIYFCLSMAMTMGENPAKEKDCCSEERRNKAITRKGGISEKVEGSISENSECSNRYKRRRNYVILSAFLCSALIPISHSSSIKDIRNDMNVKVLRIRRWGQKRSLEEEDVADQNNDQGDAAEVGDDDSNNDDNEGNKDDDGNQNQKRGGPDQDDGWYRDGLDDLVAADDDTTEVPQTDDFYAYIGEPRPPKLLPLSSREIIGYIVASTALTLGASGGIGGGGVVVPVYLLVMGMRPHFGIPIGSITVFGGALSSTIVNSQRRHPLADRPVIDWDLVLLMEPLTLAGTLVGTLLHRVLSGKLLAVLLVILLSVTAHATLTKAMRMYEAEKRYIRHLKAAQAEPPAGSPSRYGLGFGNSQPEMVLPNIHTLQSMFSSDSSTTAHEGGIRQATGDEREEILILNPDFRTLRTDLLEQEKVTPRSKIIALCCMFSVLICLNIMVGGGQFESPWNIHCGSISYWAIHALMIVFLVASAWMAQTYLIARHEIKDMVRFDYVHGDIKWDAKSSVIYPLVFVSAGLFAGLFGIGGGIVIVPLLLHSGVHPSVAAATSSAMILFTSLASSSTYWIFGLMLQDYAITGFFVGFFSSFCGQLLMRRARQARSASGRRFERNSYLAFVIGGVVLVSALLLTIQYVLTIVEQETNNATGGGLCDRSEFRLHNYISN